MRLAHIRITGDMLREGLFTASSGGIIFSIAGGLPNGSQFVRSFLIPERDEYVFVYTHESFPEALHGSIGECIEVRYAQYQMGFYFDKLESGEMTFNNARLSFGLPTSPPKKTESPTVVALSQATRRRDVAERLLASMLQNALPAENEAAAVRIAYKLADELIRQDP